MESLLFPVTRPSQIFAHVLCGSHTRSIQLANFYTCSKPQPKLAFSGRVTTGGNQCLLSAQRSAQGFTGVSPLEPHTALKGRAASSLIPQMGKLRPKGITKPQSQQEGTGETQTQAAWLLKSVC